MKKFKLFLIGLSLMTFSSFAFAIEKDPSDLENENILIQGQILEQNLRNRAEAAVEKINFDKIELELTKNNILFDVDGNKRFAGYDNNDIGTVDYEGFIRYQKQYLTFNFMDILRRGEEIDYSKVKIKVFPTPLMFPSKTLKDFIVLTECYVKFNDAQNCELKIKY